MSASASPGSSANRSGASAGSSAAARRNRFAAAGMSPRANARRAAEVVERSQLGQVAVRLLEVVAEDLLVLGLPPALAVDAIGPVDEALVQRRAGALEQAAVRGLPDQHVVEAEPLLLGRARLGAQEALAHERAEVRRYAGAHRLG